MQLIPARCHYRNVVLELITSIHARPQRMVMNFAGAGSQALAWLHSVGGSSNTILEATDRYTPASLIEALGFTPEHFTSVDVARELALKGLLRARTLEPKEPHIFGVGCTATIATNRSKRGEHRCVVAVASVLGTATYELTLSKGIRKREAEENLVSLVILKAVADAKGVLCHVELDLQENEELQQDFVPSQIFARFISGELSWIGIQPTDGSLITGETPKCVGILSGSFYPLHQGHLGLAEAATEFLNLPVCFELPLENAEKEPLSPFEVWRRVGQFALQGLLILTRESLFVRKAELFTNSVFVIGADTATRVLDPRFYNKDQAALLSALSNLTKQGIRFLVASRRCDGEVLSLPDIDVPAGFEQLFEALPENIFCMDVSSSEIRENW